MPNDQTAIERRVRASWRARACTAGLCVGAQTFLFGTGIAMPIALNGAWIAALAVLPSAALVTAACRHRLMKSMTESAQNENRKRATCALHILLALTLLLNAVFALVALVSFAQQSLIGQTRAAWSAALAVLTVFLCVLSGGKGISRLCFALRFALPGLILGLTVIAVPFRTPIGLFPILGTGALPLGMASLCMLGAASPALLLLLPPPEIEKAGDAARRCPVPKTGFFLRRVLTGAGIGVLLLFAASVCVTYESIAENSEWGARLRVIAGYQPREGIRQMTLTVLEVIAMMLLAASMLAAGERALAHGCRRMAGFRKALLLLSLLLAVCMAALIAFGFELALLTAPALVFPSAILVIFHAQMGD